MPNNMLAPAPTKQQLVQELYEVDENYNSYLETLDSEKRTRIQRSVSRMRHGLHSVAPIMCMGAAKCLFIEHCPIPPRTNTGAPVLDTKGNQVFGPAEDYPAGRPCVMESLYMQQKIIDYLQHLDVDPANPVEMSIVNELALIDLLKNRALIILSKGDRQGDGQDFMRVDITGHDPESGVSSKTSALHPAADMLDRLEKRREKWLDKLVETRKAKVDMAHKLGTTNNDSKVLNELNAIRLALQEASSREVETAEILEIQIDD